MNNDPDARPIVTGETTFCIARRNELEGFDQPDTDQCLDAYNIDWQTEEFFCWQPEELDNFYLNLIVWCPRRNIMFRSNSIDWDFNLN